MVRSTSIVTDAIVGRIMMASTMPAGKKPMPMGAPWNSGRKPNQRCSAGSTISRRIGTSTMSPHSPNTTEGMAARISTKKVTKRRTRAGDISVRNSANPIATGMAMHSAMAEVTSVP